MARYYLDTSIWLDYYEKRGANGEIATKLIEKLLLNNNQIFFSDMHIIELKHLGYTIEAIKNIISIANKRKAVTKVHISGKQFEEATLIAGIRKVPRGDALHAILCRDNECQFVTGDKDFQKLKDVTQSKKPEELI